MRIDKVYIENFKNLNKFEIDLAENFMETVLLGRNATGKSNLIEALVLIFKHLDLEETTKFSYNIEYFCRGHKVKIECGSKRTFYIDDKKITIKDFYARKNEYLPKYVFTYYSGVSNRLEEHFNDHQRKFYEKIIQPNVDAQEIEDLRKLFYVRLIHSYFVLLAFFSFEDDESSLFLRTYLGIEDLESILFVLKDPEWKGNGDPRFWGATGLVQEFLDKVWNYSVAPIYDDLGKDYPDFRSRGIAQPKLYLYISDKNKLKEIAKFYTTNTEFFKALESTYISNLIKEIKVKVKKRNVQGELTFKELSEGEQQLLTVLGLLKFTKDEESLILLDEPDTHLNPLWKWKYLKLLQQVVQKHETTQIILNTHDPLVIGSMVKEQVRIFSRNEETGKTIVFEPETDPKGLGVAGILTNVMGLPTTLDTETQEALDTKHRLIAKQQQVDLNNEERKELDEALQELEGLGFTRTFRDPLYQKFVTAWHQQERFQKPSLTPEEIEEQNELALSLLNEIMEEEQ